MSMTSSRLLPALLLSAGLLAALSVATPREAVATKEYARQEEKDCSHCHINTKGSGPRNPRGREYEANGHRFGVKSWTSDANRDRFLRASSALMATWYGEAERLLAALAEEEELRGGKALAEATRKKYAFFPRTWFRNAEKLLEKGARGRPLALAWLCRLESQFPETDEGKKAVGKLDEMAAEEDLSAEVEAARNREKVRLVYLRARTELGLGGLDDAERMFREVLADPLGEKIHKDCRELLLEVEAARAALRPGAREGEEAPAGD